MWVGITNARERNHYPVLPAIENDFDGYVVLFHDPFELPSRYSKVLKYAFKQQTKILVDPQLNSIDESLIEYDPTE